MKDLECLEQDFESYHEYGENFIFVKTILNRKMKDIQKRKSNV